MDLLDVFWLLLVFKAFFNLLFGAGCDTVALVFEVVGVLKVMRLVGVAVSFGGVEDGEDFFACGLSNAPRLLSLVCEFG